MRHFERKTTLPDDEPTSLLALAKTAGYNGTSLATNLTLEWGFSENLTVLDKDDLDPADGRDLAASPYTYPSDQVDLSQLFLYQNSGSDQTVSLSFSGLGAYVR